MAEFATATSKLRNIEPAISIFGSARLTEADPYYQKAMTVAFRLSEAGFSVITGGGPGIMEAANRGAYAGPLPSVGLNIALPHEQISNKFQDISLNFHYFFARKTMFAQFALAYVAFPGGFGTFDELSECLTLIQTGKTRKVPVILVGRDFWQGAIDWIRDQVLARGMVSEAEMALVTLVEEPDEVIDAIFEFYRERDLTPTPEELARMSFL